MRRPNARVDPRGESREEGTTLAATTTTASPAASSRMGARRSGGGSRRRLLVGALALLVASVLALLLLVARSPSRRYGVVIDAGSTGSRVHVIAYRSAAAAGAGAGAGALPRIDWARTASMKATPGLSSFASDPGSAGRSLGPLVEFARRRVPPESWAETDVRLMATAGLRLLDAAVAEAVLESCRVLLRESGFQFQDEWATVISGAEEGTYAWIAANYALGTLGDDSQDTTGIIELGGASVQVTFVTDKPLPPEFSHTLKFGDVTYNLYSHSFLHLGQNVAYESLHDMLSTPGLKSMATHLISQAKYRDPCTPRGFSSMEGAVKLPASVLESKVDYRPYAHAVGNFSECRSAALTLLQKGREECRYHECRMGAAFVPDLVGNFVATENFYHTSKFFGLRSKSFLSALMLAGEQFCHGDWSKIKKEYRSFNEGELLLFCFSSAYIVALLHDTLKVPLDDKRIDVANQIGGMPVDWALGAFIVQKASNQTDMLHPEGEKISPEDDIRYGERPVHHNQGEAMISLARRRWDLVESLRWGGASGRVCKFS
ncbi:probable apyrase 6 isoform X2 [Oryza brachyantha]|uniref:probable apyrase 6 isoform X2 n=1 Tax=Oryza brachyantha TaxID=4533 RepID=UPI001ADA4C1C|nr:probable apyrase 6 isoform X2 [Oryza brachyantha]